MFRCLIPPYSWESRVPSGGKAPTFSLSGDSHPPAPVVPYLKSEGWPPPRASAKVESVNLLFPFPSF